jgi:hypothetical protein
MNNSLDLLKPADYNPRRITPAQKEALRRSYEKFGDLSGVILNRRTGTLVGGHQRISLFRASTNAKIETKPHKDRTGTVSIGYVVVPRENGGTTRIPYRVVDWDGKTEMAANVAANSAGGEFDEQKLGYVLSTLQKGKFAIEDIPLGSNEWRSSIRAFELSQERESEKGGKTDKDQPEAPTLTKAEQAVQRRAWKKMLQEWHEHVQSIPKLKSPTPNITRGALIVQFIEALLEGKKISRLATTAYVPHRLFVPGDKEPVSKLFGAAVADQGVLDSVIWYARSLGQNASLDKFLSGTLAIHGHRAPADFPADLALSLIEEFCRRGSRILDPCHGWGGRMLGFMLSRRAAEYVGFDVDPKTYAGVKQMYQDLVPFAGLPKKATTFLKPFEKAKLTPRSFDFALTSPPYFDTERYDGAESSWKQYKNFDAWVQGFYGPLIKKVHDALKPGASFCLQVGSQSYPLEAKAKEIAPKVGFKWIETRPTSMVNNYTATEADKGEVVVVLKRIK